MGAASRRSGVGGQKLPASETAPRAGQVAPARPASLQARGWRPWPQAWAVTQARHFADERNNVSAIAGWAQGVIVGRRRKTVQGHRDEADLVPPKGLRPGGQAVRHHALAIARCRAFPPRAG